MRAVAREGVVERELTVSCGLRVRHTERRRRRPKSECAVTLGAPPKISAPLLSLHTYPILPPHCFFVRVSAPLSSRSTHSLARRLTCLPSRSISLSFALSLMCESLSFLSPLFPHLAFSPPTAPDSRVQTELFALSLSLFRSLSLAPSLHPQHLSCAASTNAREPRTTLSLLSTLGKTIVRCETYIFHALTSPTGFPCDIT